MINIRLKKKEGKVLFVYDNQEKEFSFESIDWLIEKIVCLDDKDLDVSLDEQDESLKNYKQLLEKINEEINTSDFRQKYKTLNKSNITNDEIETELFNVDK